MPLRPNPFHQPAKQWQIRLVAQRPQLDALEEALGEGALSVTTFEVNERDDVWGMDILTDAPPDRDMIAARLALVSGLLRIPMPPCEITQLMAKDWISEVERSFPPIHAGRFYIYGSHIAAPPPCGSIPLRITAGAAFGSGEHATTSGCLRALGLIARKRRFARPLDMGCGSGILAIAMAKLWRRPVTGIDIDAVSIRVAAENTRLNRVHAWLRLEAGDGYYAPLVRAQGPFDLIAANILARPLMRMAPELARHLMPGGTAILSGLLASQERMVLAAHRAQGLKLEGRITQNGWQTLILGKPCRSMSEHAHQ